MTSPDPIVLCTYRYDPLDRLASSSPVGQTDVQRFYQKNRLATEIEGALQRTVFQHEDLLLAQQRHVDGVVDTTLLATDQQRSVLRLVDKSGIEPVAYSAYGHHPAESGLTSLLGFNGERRDPVTGHYLLGNGYRAYNPVLMRFNSPDSLSPFDEGGLNAYGYCGGDPVGFVDPSGQITIVAIRAISKVGFLSFRKARIRSKPITSKIKQLVSQNDQTSVVTYTTAGASSPIKTRRGGVREWFANRDPTVDAALKNYKQSLDDAGITKIDPGLPVYRKGQLVTEPFEAKIQYRQAQFDYVARLEREGSDRFNRSTLINKKSAVRREKRNYAKYLQNPARKNESVRS
ncbi:RHS repeat-associated core domain-containing protein [Pseudomonas sp. SZ57]|uniref:RHS repeat-associated core domain-containing protein n=1 Tax=Pseudomonas sp. SZ57 TaxID=2662259 RepID=UPI002115006C|nr:RHS repeat-associated core domain-containing protein [Pseudomonas sp. SZ57]